jgi:hypothetical protein
MFDAGSRTALVLSGQHYQYTPEMPSALYQQDINTKKEGTSAYCKKPSGSVGERRGLNPRHAEPQSAALPTELRSP